MMESIENDARMRKCPSFINCSAPKCPLDEFIEQRSYLTGEPKCTATGSPVEGGLGDCLSESESVIEAATAGQLGFDLLLSAQERRQ